MGDARFEGSWQRLEQAKDRAGVVRDMPYEELVKALAASSRARDPLLANVLATEMLNRYRRGMPVMIAAAVGVLVGSVLGFTLTLFFALHPENLPDIVFPAVLVVALLLGIGAAVVAHAPLRRALLLRRV